MKDFRQMIDEAFVEENGIGADIRECLIERVAEEISRFGDDKVLHFTGSVILASFEGYGDTPTHQMMTSTQEAFKEGIDKEMYDKAVSEDVRNEVMKKLESVMELFVEIADIAKENELDQGDLTADMIGIGVGIALKGLRLMDYELSPKRGK